jgi:hypothetical protein
MKEVSLKTVLIGDKVELNYLEQMIHVLSQPENQQTGTNYEEMARVLPIMNKLKAVEPGASSVKLEDSEHLEVVKRLKKVPFTVNDEALFEMIKTISEAEDVTVK